MNKHKVLFSYKVLIECTIDSKMIYQSETFQKHEINHHSKTSPRCHNTTLLTFNMLLLAKITGITWFISCSLWLSNIKQLDYLLLNWYFNQDNFYLKLKLLHSGVGRNSILCRCSIRQSCPVSIRNNVIADVLRNLCKLVLSLMFYTLYSPKVLPTLSLVAHEFLFDYVNVCFLQFCLPSWFSFNMTPFFFLFQVDWHIHFLTYQDV